MIEPALTQAMTAVDLAFTDPPLACRLATAAAARANGDAEAASVARRALGMAFTALERLADAEAQLRAAIELAEGSGLVTRAAEARGSLGYTLLLTGRTEGAIAELDRAAPHLGGLSAARLRMLRGLVLSEAGRFDEAGAGFADALAALHRTDRGRTDRGRADQADADQRDAADLLEADIRTNRSILRVQLRDWRGAEDDLRRAERIYTATGHPGRTAMVYHNRGLAAAVRGDIPAALTSFDEAAERYRAAGRGLGLLPIERAEALLAVRLVAEARQAAEDAVAEFTASRNAVDLVQARLLLAQAALLDGDPATGREQAERARRSAQRQGRPGWAALAGHLALRSRWEAGEHSDATLRAGRRAVAALERAGWVVQAHDARLIVARTALRLGRVAAARRELTMARDGRDGPAELRARSWHAESLLRLSGGDRAGATTALRAGMRVLDRFRTSLGATELRVHASGIAGELAGLGLRLATESGNPEAALRWAEEWRAGALRLRPVRPPDDAAVAGDLVELRRVMVALADAAAGGADPAGLLRRQAALEDAVRRRTRHAAGNRTGDQQTQPSVAQLRAALGPRALVEYLDLDGQLHAVVVAGRAVRLRRLGHADAVRQHVAALRSGLRRLAYQRGSADSLAAAAALVDDRARRLAAVLLDPLVADIGDRPLVIVPTGALHAVPWPALAGTAGRPASVAPSATLWHRAATAPAGAGGALVLAAGPGLPHAAAEVAALARTYPDARRFTGRRATVERVMAALDGAHLGHVAAHGHFRSDNPLFSSLRLVDGPLTVYDLERLARPPRHVVLSACDSGLPAVHPGDELLGLTAALVGLGSSTLVASVVPVPDEASRPLMLRLHRHLRDGHGPAAALAMAGRELAGDPGSPERVAAAGFVCFGAG